MPAALPGAAWPPPRAAAPCLHEKPGIRIRQQGASLLPCLHSGVCMAFACKCCSVAGLECPAKQMLLGKGWSLCRQRAFFELQQGIPFHSDSAVSRTGCDALAPAARFDGCWSIHEVIKISIGRWSAGRLEVGTLKRLAATASSICHGRVTCPIC